MTLAILHFPDEAPAWLGRLLPARLFGLLVRASRYKRNPRDEETLRRLLAERHGDEQVATVRANELSPEALRAASTIVLVWPDGNGYGWGRVERRVFAGRAAATPVRVLNGRRRWFELTPRVRRGYLLRRIVERLWLGELAFLGVFVVVSPVLVAWDWLRGKS